ncbi:MAG: hypothetical protein K0Q79_3075 [Flavipsychrobacter sp.]|jgi:hypothetical protein|nr:hypothetical protein [Flavipsychrobacter sp.]
MVQIMHLKNKSSKPKPATTATFKNPKNRHGTVSVPSRKIDLEAPGLISYLYSDPENFGSSLTDWTVIPSGASLSIGLVLRPWRVSHSIAECVGGDPQISGLCC